MAIYAVIRLLQNEHNSPNYSPQKYNKIEEQQIRYHIDQQVKKQFESSQEKIVDEVVEKVRYCQKLDEKEKKEDEANLATRFVNMGGKLPPNQ